MRNKTLAAVSFIALTAILFAPFQIYAATVSGSDANAPLPDQDGIYDVANNPDLKLQVEVLRAAPEQNALEQSYALPINFPRINLPKMPRIPTGNPPAGYNPPAGGGKTAPKISGNCSDPNSSVPDSFLKSHLPSGAWTYSLNTRGVPSSVGAGNLATIASKSLSEWASAANSKVNFEQSSNSSSNRGAKDGKNTIAFGPAPQRALGVTYTWYDRSGAIAEVDTILNSALPWTWSGSSSGVCDPSAYDAQNILTHELGHWMGLADSYSSSAANNTMFGYGAKGEIKKGTLATGDINSVRAIYR